MLTLEQLRGCLAMVVPVYFAPAIDGPTIRGVLEDALSQLEFFCRPHHAVLVVDRGTAAEQVLRSASPDSPLSGLPLEIMERNRGKAGAVRAGLKWVLSHTQAGVLVTRDCDGDGALEDLPHLAGLLADMENAAAPAAVFGVRTSLSRSMNWEREQWERLTNQVVERMIDFALASGGRVQDRTFWNGLPLDLQAGFRAYNRSGAELAIQALSRLPEDPQVYLLANEVMPYFEISLKGGRVGQLLRKSVVEQPISSFSNLPFPRCYGRLLGFAAQVWSIPPPALLQMFDNAMVELPGYFSSLRRQFLECRSCLAPDAPPPKLPRIS